MIYLTLFLEFFKVGLFCFGGAFGMIPLIRETVLAYGWLTDEAFYDFIGVCESTPGPIAVNVATYVGATQGGVFGSICATLGVVMPSFIIILLIAAVLKNLTKNAYFAAFLSGVKPVAVALILATGISLLLKSAGLTGASFSPHVPSLIVFALLFVVYFGVKRVCKRSLSSIWLILLSAVMGLAVCLMLEYYRVAV
ncbi:MAG: chromate transporter [Ruminococcaceae bacterium]|nr:chromate transporter [Oscillospiraceae bacterium]